MTEAEYPDAQAASELLSATYLDLNKAMAQAARGFSSRIHQLDQSVTFMLDNHQEVRLQVQKIEIMHRNGNVEDFKVHCRTDFENVLILAQKIKMRISAFSAYFTVILSATEDFKADWNDAIVAMDKPAAFFETLDDIKRPIFLNLNHYIFARISK